MSNLKSLESFKTLSLVALLTLALPASAAFAGSGTAPSAPPPPQTVGGTMQVRAADGTVAQQLTFTTIEHQCVDTKLRDGTRSFEAQVCHREDTPNGRVLHVSWSLADDKRVQSHDAWAVVAVGGTMEVGAAKGKGDALVVKVTK